MNHTNTLPSTSLSSGQSLLHSAVLAYAARRIHDPSLTSKQNHLIVLEGLDGVGKTTTAQGLAEELDCIAWSSPINQISRDTRHKIDIAAFQTPVERFDFYRTANQKDSREHIAPALSNGKSIILDRYSLSTVIGNLAVGAHLDNHPAIISDINSELDIVVPTATVLITLDEQIRQQRVSARTAQLSKADHLIDESVQTQQRALSFYRELAPFGLIEVDITGLKVNEVIKKIIDNLKLNGINFS